MRLCYVARCSVFFVTVGIICSSPITKRDVTDVGHQADSLENIHTVPDIVEVEAEQTALQEASSLSGNQRSLNDFMACLRSCTASHTHDIHNTASEARIRLFCNQSCFMTFENSGIQAYSHHSDATTTSRPSDGEGVVG